MTRSVGKLGKLAPQFPVGLKELPFYAAQPLPTPPASVDFTQAVSGGFSMDGNDAYGDCTMAAAAHMIQSWNAETSIDLPVPAEADVVTEYLKLTHGKDSGLVESHVLKTWQGRGLWGTKIAAYAPVNVHALDVLKQAVAFFGGAYVGIQVPQNAEEQFRLGNPWTLDPDWQNQPIIGGHAVPILGYDAQWLYVVTWGAVHKMAWDWWSTYGDEAWAILSQEFEQAGTVNGIDVAALKADLPRL